MDMQDATRGIALELDDDLPRPIGVEAIDGWVPGSGERSITISLPSEDTSGQILRDPRTIDVVVIGDDTEGHSLSLRFPNSQDAGEFRRRLMLTGALAGTLVVGSITASTAMNQSANSVGIGAQPAAVQAAPAPPADQVTSTSEYAVSHDGAVAAPAVDSAPLTSEYAASHNGAVTAPAVDSAPLTSEYAASHNGAVTAPAVDSAPLTSEYAASHGTGAAGTAAVSSVSLTSEYAAPHGTVLTGDVPIPSTTLTSEYAASHGSGAEVTAPVDPGSL